MTVPGLSEVSPEGMVWMVDKGKRPWMDGVGFQMALCDPAGLIVATKNYLTASVKVPAYSCNNKLFNFIY